MPMLVSPVTTGPDGEFELPPCESRLPYVSRRAARAAIRARSRSTLSPAMARVVLDVKPGGSIAGKVVDGKASRSPRSP